MKNRAIHFFFFILFCFLIPSSLKAENYKVGIGIENRFINQNDDGSYTGFEIDLWKEIAKQLKIEYSFQKEDLFPQLLDQLKKGEVDFGIWMMSMNRERADYITYSYPYFVSDLAILTPAYGHTIGILLRPIFKPIVARLIIMIVIVMFVSGNILWLTERGPNSIISDKYFPGIFQAMWCSFAIQSTIGFGDIIPRRWIARIISIPIWICGLLLVAIITAQLLTNYTNEAFHSPLHDYQDLNGKVVATVAGSNAVEALEDLGVKKLITVPTAADLKALYPRLESKEIDAIVFDYPAIADLADTLQKEGKRPFIVADHFHQQFYAIALNKKFAESHPELLENINLKILELKDNGFIRHLRRKWFGKLGIQ